MRVDAAGLIGYPVPTVQDGASTTRDGGAIDSLSESQLGRLQSAVDGIDHREAAFEALVEHALSWTSVKLSELPLPDLELDLLLSQPRLHRGRLFKIKGRVEQVGRLAPPYGDVSEWFVRDRVGRPLLVYVCGDYDSSVFVVGATVEVPVRYYKRVDAVAQDKRKHSYAAFVGGKPNLLRGAGALSGALVSFGAVVAAIVVGVIAISWWSRKQRTEEESGAGSETAPPRSNGTGMHAGESSEIQVSKIQIQDSKFTIQDSTPVNPDPKSQINSKVADGSRDGAEPPS
jgi:hypothetical protein